MDKKMEDENGDTKEKHLNGTKLIYRQKWSEQTTQKLPNKGP